MIEEAERSMISGVIRLGDRSVRAVMTPRTEVEMVKVNEDIASLKRKLIATNHSCLPVFDDDRDDVIVILRGH
ncbi:CBS domain containing-hemolysin-like protein [Phyllobacterium trifolii]|uniref:CBS domain containing-hemolysin-like protein n=1 Tax=Phyllobacterium trifolii TaxID=300193 RepID=A0A839UFN6_9HYPH|nr:hypothetical protein [Phyllobacterium trifolii]MBB3147642.1 CBS domain containing-hemolysin-like protein [Phyllobacterium trifolii]